MVIFHIFLEIYRLHPKTKTGFPQGQLKGIQLMQ